MSGKIPRYYQVIAINLIIESILLGQKRILATMATGTGKTCVAFQLCWKLWNSRWTNSSGTNLDAYNSPAGSAPGMVRISRTGEYRRPKILFLADRNILVDDPMAKMFAPFGDARYKISSSDVSQGREMYFGIYQALTNASSDVFRQYRPDFFDLIIIDECRRGSSRNDTIVRLPQGVFAPYTDIPANLLFFQRGGPTETIWYYEQPLPEGRKKYSKTAPLQFEELEPALNWWQNREGNPQAWKVDFAGKRAIALAAAEPYWQRAESERAAALAVGKQMRELEQALAAASNSDKAALQTQLRDLKARQQAHDAAAKSAQSEGDALYWPIYNLDLKNPHAKEGLEHADPKDLIASMRSHESEVMRLLGEIEALVHEVEQ